jgi:hypothetical protein
MIPFSRIAESLIKRVVNMTVDELSGAAATLPARHLPAVSHTIKGN